MGNTTYAKISILAATTLTVGACLSAGMAFADPDPQTPPNAGAQSGAGATTLTMVLENAGQEYGGTDAEDPYANPDGPDADEWGDNLAFSAPSTINFVAKADGTLLAPSSGIDIVNRSVMPVRVSSLKIDENSSDGWHVVSGPASAANVQNAVWGEIGVAGDMLAWSDYTAAKAGVHKAYEWNMTSSGSSGDSLSLSASGSFANLDRDLSTAQTFATIHWYLRIGAAVNSVDIVNGDAVHGTFSVQSAPGAQEGVFLPGATAYVVTVPDAGYRLASVTVVETGSGDIVPAVVDGDTATFTVPAGGATVTPVFEKVDYGLSASPATANGTFIMSRSASATTPDATAQHGDDVYIIADPDVGYELSEASVTGDVTGDGVETTLIGDDKARFTMPAEPVSASATFTKMDYPIMRTPTANGSFVVGSSALSTTNLATAQYGDTVFVNAAPDTGYKVRQIKVTGGTSGTVTNLAVSDNKASFTMPAEAVTVSVTFDKEFYVFTTVTTANGPFVLSSSDSGSPTIAGAHYGDTVYIKTTPNAGYKVSSISTVPSTTVTTVTANSLYSFTMPASNMTVRVTVTKEDYSLTQSPTSNGSFELSSSDSGSPTITTAQYGDTVYIVTTPAANYKVGSMSVAEAGTNTPVTLTRPVGGNDNVGSFTMPANGVSVSVAFELAVISAKAHVSGYTMSELKTISADIRSNGTDSPYYSTFNAFARTGENVTVTLHDGTTTKNATLVDASADYGLVFMLDSIGDASMNSSATNAGGWTSSAMRTSLRSGGALYNQYLDGMTMSLADATPQAVAPASVTTYSSDYNGGTPQQQTTTGDTFFLASAKEVYGGTATDVMVSDYGTNQETGCHQFAYFANLGVTGTSYSVLKNANGFAKAAGATWWLRSAGTYGENFFWQVGSNGRPADNFADAIRGVLPCFCL